MKEVDDQYSEMAGKMLSSDVKLDVLTLFHRNPGLTDKADGIAMRIGRTASQLDEAMEDLVELGVLKKEKIGGVDVFYFDRVKDAEIQRIFADRLKRGLSQ